MKTVSPPVHPLFKDDPAASWFLVCVASISKVDAVQNPRDFDQQIAPILVQHCVECHQAKSPQVASYSRLERMDAWR